MMAVREAEYLHQTSTKSGSQSSGTQLNRSLAAAGISGVGVDAMARSRPGQKRASQPLPGRLL